MYLKYYVYLIESIYPNKDLFLLQSLVTLVLPIDWVNLKR